MSVTQGASMTAESAVFKGSHPIWIRGEEIMKSVGVVLVLVNRSSFIKLELLNMNAVVCNHRGRRRWQQVTHRTLNCRHSQVVKLYVYLSKTHDLMVSLPVQVFSDLAVVFHNVVSWWIHVLNPNTLLVFQTFSSFISLPYLPRFWG